MKGRPWDDPELAVLRLHYPDMDTGYLARLLGRTPTAVYGMANILGLKKSAAFKKARWGFRPGVSASPGTQFRPGHTPANKGVKGWDAGGDSAKTRFKPGRRPHT